FHFFDFPISYLNSATPYILTVIAFWGCGGCAIAFRDGDIMRSLFWGLEGAIAFWEVWRCDRCFGDVEGCDRCFEGVWDAIAYSATKESPIL
ncbi:hypothetical protein PN476_14695, partial [Dolichospermum circinale CS-537/05]|nr:hypothetical protein [Dolichospermum circinale CS-537/05]